MSNQLIALLGEWHPLRDDTDWVLGTVYQSEGPSYRKAGALMLFSAQGHQLGMLSGGCLESDIHRHARRVMHSRKALTLTYDGSDEDDISYQLGIGCGGTVHILLQPVGRDNDYLMLESVLHALRESGNGHYYQLMPDSAGQVAARFMEDASSTGFTPSRPSSVCAQRGQRWLHTHVTPPPHLLIVGGGNDARPVASIGHQLGWCISIWDPRPANGRREYFPSADMLLSGAASELSRYADSESVNAAVLMSHNIRLDVEALRALHDCRLGYLALLGPDSRRQRVLAEAGLTPGALGVPLAGPAGLDIGGELPETIALAILAECQAALHHCCARSLSGVLATEGKSVQQPRQAAGASHLLIRSTY